MSNVRYGKDGELRSFLPDILLELSSSNSVGKIKKIYGRFQKKTISLIDGGATAANITKVITSVSDIITQKLISFAIDKLGTPTCKFVFTALGSEGRREQTLKTDQDNAIIYEDVPKTIQKQSKKYFLELGKKICDDMNMVGYSYCKGKIMAKNPKWCKPLSVWKGYFSEWINLPNPLEIRKINIFFDLRCVYGNKELVNNLRNYIGNVVKGKSVFFLHLAQNALTTKLPIGLLGNFVVEHGGSHHDSFNIKQVLGVIADFARIYALKNNIGYTNTPKRLKYIFAKKILEKSEYEEILESYNHLMQIS
jgi:CBS domain-containing protein